AGKDSQKRSLGQADHRTAIVYEQDLVAGQRQFISASRTDTVDGRQKLDAGVPAGVLDGKARLVRELAEVHFPGVRGFAQHEDIGAGAEDSLLQASDDNRADARVFEAYSLDRVGQFDVDAKVVRIEFQLVCRREPAILSDVHRQSGNWAIDT